MNETVDEAMAWIQRMADRHGPLVRGHGRLWDWGQALAVECYGSPADWPDAPTESDMERARRWEAGEWPEWATPQYPDWGKPIVLPEATR